MACYVRVSTDKQSTENQEPDIRRMLTARSNGPAEEQEHAATWYRETGSAAKRRPVFERLMEDARLGKFRKLYVWSLDRFGRSMFQNLRDLRLLVETYRVTVVSVREPWVESTSDPMTRTLLLSVLGWVAEFERERLIQRTNAGLDRARAKGTKLGRPSAGIPDGACACAMELAGGSWRARVAFLYARGWRASDGNEYSPATLRRACAKWVQKQTAEIAETAGASAG